MVAIAYDIRRPGAFVGRAFHPGFEVDSLLDRILTVRRRGVTVVVVEHNMELVMNVADRVLVMDYGQHLFEGVPADVQKNAAVVSAYLGGELV